MACVYHGTDLLFESGDSNKVLDAVAGSGGHIRVKCCGFGWSHANNFRGLSSHLHTCTAKTPAVKPPVVRKGKKDRNVKVDEAMGGLDVLTS